VPLPPPLWAIREDAARVSCSSGAVGSSSNMGGMGKSDDYDKTAAW